MQLPALTQVVPDVHKVLVDSKEGELCLVIWPLPKPEHDQVEHLLQGEQDLRRRVPG